MGLEKYCKKQKRFEEEMGFRPSEYFGAVTVDHLEDGIEDERIDGNWYFINNSYRIIPWLFRSEA